MKNDIKKWVDSLEDKAISTLRSKLFWLKVAKWFARWVCSTKTFKKIVAKIDALLDKIDKKHNDIITAKKK